LIACRGYLEHIEDEIESMPDSTREKIDKIRQSLFKMQKIIQERIETIK